MKSSLFTTLKATVMKQTVQDLNARAKDMGLSVGEVLDRAIPDLSPRNVDMAHSLILDDISLRCAHLDNEEFNDVIALVAETLLQVYREENPGGNRARLQLLLEAYQQENGNASHDA